MNHNVGAMCISPPHTNHNVGSAWPALAPLQNLEERRWQQAHLFTSHTKTWSYWRSAPTSAYI